MDLTWVIPFESKGLVVDLVVGCCCWVVVVPFQGESSVQGTGPICGDFVFVLIALTRWCASSLEKYLTPKLSTHKVNMVGLVVWRQRPGVHGEGSYPCGARQRMSWSKEMTPASLRSYMPRLISRYIKPSVVMGMS